MVHPYSRALGPWLYPVHNRMVRQVARISSASRIYSFEKVLVLCLIIQSIRCAGYRRLRPQPVRSVGMCGRWPLGNKVENHADYAGQLGAK
jgi:hypothetical protein